MGAHGLKEQETDAERRSEEGEPLGLEELSWQRDKIYIKAIVYLW